MRPTKTTNTAAYAAVEAKISTRLVFVNVRLSVNIATRPASAPGRPPVLEMEYGIKIALTNSRAAETVEVILVVHTMCLSP